MTEEAKQRNKTRTKANSHIYKTPPELCNQKRFGAQKKTKQTRYGVAAFAPSRGTMNGRALWSI